MRLCDVRLLRQEMEEYRQLAAFLPEKGNWQTSALQKKLRRTAEQLASELWEISCFIGEMEDPELRLIFELRYFRGYTWREVAAHLPTLLSADGARMKHDRYLKTVVGSID